MTDVWSRKIVAAEFAAALVAPACERRGVEPRQLALQADNGGPMKGATMLAALQLPGVVSSCSSPGASDDSP